MRHPLTVMVTAVGGGGLGEQILKALHLAKTDYQVVGTDVTPYSKGLREVDHACVVPPAVDPTYIETILGICEQQGVRALLPGSEAELRVLGRARSAFERQRIFLPINPEPVLELCLDKSQTMRSLLEHGFTVPRTVKIEEAADLEQVDFFPAVLKPSIGGGGSANLFLAQTPDELRVFGRYLLEICPEYIVQEYVGDPESEYTVGVLCSMDGELINTIALRRNILSALSNRLKAPNRTGNRALGPILAISSGVSQGQIGRFPEVTGPCAEIATRLGCTGPVNIQCRLVDERVHVFEINPRFSGTTSLRAMVGYNEPDVLIRRHVLGEEVHPFFPYGSGTIVRGLQECLINPAQVAGTSPTMASMNWL